MSDLDAVVGGNANCDVQRVVGIIPFRRWTVVVPRIPGYVHVAALQELVDAVFYGLRQLEQNVSLGNPHDAVPGNAILIGAHLLSAEACARVPDSAIVYNSEHASSDWMNSHYRALLGRVVVWDYSFDNTRMLEGLLGRQVAYVPLGYVPQFTRITAVATEDIDVLFCGSYAARRGVIFDSIRSRGLRFHHAFGVYGAERDALMTRAKIVLNVHAHEPGAFEIVRVSYQLANRKAVVSEVNPGERIDTDLDGAFVAAAYEDIVTKVVELAKDRPAREAIGLAGYRKFSSRDQAAILRRALGDRIA
ncbi:MAG: hypothetical protein QOD93_327 [Acetobacteraceae bacterium]|nr:hypothetical protein [Acetobacteraceae bacterium]